MKAFIVYCHPSEESFTRNIRDSFIKGIVDSGNDYILSDLYKMNFKSDMSEKEYLRDARYQDTDDIAADVLLEHEKINSSDAIVFIYPVFWTEAPAKLVGWFDRVWTYGFAYGENKRMKMLDKALILCSAGNPLDRLEKFGLLGSDGDLGSLFLRDEPIGNAVVIGTENDFIVTGREGHLIEMVLDGRPFENPGRDILPDRTPGNPEIIAAPVQDTVQKRHRNLGWGQQADTVPFHGIGDVIPRIDGHRNPAVRGFQFNIFGLQGRHGKKSGQQNK